jgi:hypothetical protein
VLRAIYGNSVDSPTTKDPGPVLVEPIERPVGGRGDPVVADRLDGAQEPDIQPSMDGLRKRK